MILKIDLTRNAYSLNWCSALSEYKNASINRHGALYATDTLRWPADEKIEVAYRLHNGGHVDKFRSEAEWKSCKRGLELPGPTSIFGGCSLIVMLRPKSLTLWCFDPEFNIKPSWFDFKKIQIGKIWPGPSALGADD